MVHPIDHEARGLDPVHQAADGGGEPVGAVASQLVASEEPCAGLVGWGPRDGGFHVQVPPSEPAQRVEGQQAGAAGGTATPRKNTSSNCSFRTWGRS